MRYELATAVILALVVAMSGSFAVAGTGTGNDDPGAFEDLLSVGMTQVEVSEADRVGAVIPRAQVYYARFEFGVGYYGVESLVARLQRPGHEDRYGRPLVVYVSDFAGEGANRTAEGYLTTDALGEPDWVRAEDAHFVVGSEARLPAGPTVVPFSSRADAERFTERFGGRIERWETVRELPVADDGRSPAAWRETVRQRAAWADGTVTATDPLLDRPVAATVDPGESVAAAVQRAPPNTTVRLRPGVHRVRNLTVRKPLTLRGAGSETVLLGDGNGTVVEFRAPSSAISSLRVAGVGDRQVGNLSRAENWSERIRLAYAVADAGVRFVDANGSLAHDIGVRTPANGIVFIESDGSVAREVRVVGDTPWSAGFMDLLAFRSRVVVQDSQFQGGRDAVYTHRADGLVVRNNTMEGVRFGVHEMYTSNALVRDNDVRNTAIGVVVMTRPTGNAIVGNAVRDSAGGVSVAGSRSYVADNVLFDNRYGVQTTSSGSYYVGNLLARNEDGARTGTLLPTNRVTRNDFVDNGEHARDRSMGSLQVWTVDGVGNYWTGAPGYDRDGDGALDRAFRPTGPVDGPAARTTGGPALARSPAVALVRAMRTSVPGFRRAGVLDTAPLTAPAGTDPASRLARARERTEPLPDPLVAPVPANAGNTTVGTTSLTTDTAATTRRTNP
ncbi:NosD domain-containing protein [Haloglomus halophilum]|uniref:NosD domain-containing protein n=1 Tax=Haloglomus halophilum TaxID=2962672 RepID=UPI0020C94C6E|nr:NosD domain-containing protein [Haloglomus halophilum]